MAVAGLSKKEKKGGTKEYKREERERERESAGIKLVRARDTKDHHLLTVHLSGMNTVPRHLEHQDRLGR
jgi:hypothetical protein